MSQIPELSDLAERGDSLMTTLRSHTDDLMSAEDDAAQIQALRSMSDTLTEMINVFDSIDRITDEIERTAS